MAKYLSARPGAGKEPRAHRLVPSRVADAFRVEERAGLTLATRVRAAALAAVGVWVLLLEDPPVLYWYEGVIALLALTGAAHFMVASRLERPWWAYVLVAVDAAALVFGLVFLTAYLQPDWPAPMALRAAPVAYFFLLIAYVAVGYSPGLMLWSGIAGATAWATGVLWVSTRAGARAWNPQATDPASLLELHLDPQYVDISMRLEEIAILVVTAVTLAFVVRRSRELVIRQTEVARERANLARYFSPRLVDELAGRDEPLGPVRRQQVGVLFADIVGFTALAETMSPEDVMALLREYHGRMEREVFRHNGTLEKFIGDALLATFGVPRPSPHDATDALACARALLAELKRWNDERTAAGEQPIRIGIGVHYGPAVLGDIGSDRNMAFAVIGDTVNLGSRLQALTRELQCEAVVSSALMDALRREQGHTTIDSSLVDGGEQRIRGRDEPVHVWVLGARPRGRLP
jgi:adenylate cyclase